MADTFTITGLDEMRRAVDALPSDVTVALKRVAQGSANAIVLRARQRLAQSPDPPLKGESQSHGATAKAIEVVEDTENKQYIVESKSPPGMPTNLVIWREFGTVHQPARPYMRPAIDAERAVYLQQVEEAAVSVVKKALE